MFPVQIFGHQNKKKKKQKKKQMQKSLKATTLGREMGADKNTFNYRGEKGL